MTADQVSGFFDAGEGFVEGTIAAALVVLWIMSVALHLARPYMVRTTGKFTLRLGADLTQRRLEAMTGIDQTVISRLENGKQYGLRWSRYAVLVAVLHDRQPAPEAPTPWWVEIGIPTPTAWRHRPRADGLMPEIRDEDL